MLFTYTGEPGRYYPALGLQPTPGESYTLDGDPGDGRWKPTKPKHKTAEESK